MKKMLFSAIAMVAFAGSAFASNEVISTEINTTIEFENKVVENTRVSEKVEFAKTCYINIFNSRGVLLDTVAVTDVPDNVACSSKSVSDAAIYHYTHNHYVILP